MAKKKKQAKRTRKVASGASPRNGNIPPPEHRWKKGQSGNPSGCPKGTISLTARLRRIVEADDGRVGEALVKVATKAALNGDHRFWTSIIERLDGKVADKVEGDTNITIQVNHVEKALDDD